VLLGGSVASPIRRSQSLDIIGRCHETNFEPGTSFLYSNANFLLVTEILERQSGQSLGDLMQHHIFDPAGLTATRYEPLHSDIIPHRATGYLKRSEGYQLAALQTELTGDGALVSTLTDMIRWAEYCDRDPDGRISRISERCIFANGRHSDYGLGYYIRDYNGLATLGHNGTWPGFRSEILRVPERSLSVIGLANVNMIDLSGLTRDIVDLMAARQSENAPAWKRKQAQTFAAITKGAYLNSETGDFFHLAESDGTLAFGIYGGELELVADTPSTSQFRYSHEYRSVDWSQAEHGIITLTKMNGETITARSAESLEPARDLPDYCGNFYHDEIGIKIQLVPDANDLRVKFDGAFAPHLTWRVHPISCDAILVYSDDGDWRCQFVLIYPKTGKTKGQ
ncbi:MAG: serine hydrolase, partial [Amphritea sp.]|nr:serine hydrolase [Amphritea sp.]